MNSQRQITMKHSLLKMGLVMITACNLQCHAQQKSVKLSSSTGKRSVGDNEEPTENNVINAPEFKLGCLAKYNPNVAYDKDLSINDLDSKFNFVRRVKLSGVVGEKVINFEMQRHIVKVRALAFFDNLGFAVDHKSKTVHGNMRRFNTRAFSWLRAKVNQSNNDVFLNHKDLKESELRSLGIHSLIALEKRKESNRKTVRARAKSLENSADFSISQFNEKAFLSISKEINEGHATVIEKETGHILKRIISIERRLYSYGKPIRWITFLTEKCQCICWSYGLQNMGCNYPRQFNLGKELKYKTKNTLQLP